MRSAIRTAARLLTLLALAVSPACCQDSAGSAAAEAPLDAAAEAAAREARIAARAQELAEKAAHDARVAQQLSGRMYGRANCTMAQLPQLQMQKSWSSKARARDQPANVTIVTQLTITR